MSDLPKEALSIMNPTYCDKVICPLDKEPCMGATCAKWYELIPATKNNASYGKCTVVIFIKQNGETVTPNQDGDHG